MNFAIIMLMDPNYQPPANPTPTQGPAPSGEFNSSQFDFIMNDGQKKKSLFPSGSPKQRIIMIVIAVLVGLIGVVLLYLVFFSGGSSNTAPVVAVAQKQTEIIRIAAIGSSKAGGTDAKKLAAITSITVSTDQQKTIAYLAKQGKKIKGKELSATASATVDSDLTAAERNGRFDEVFVRTLTEKLKDYQTSMETAFPTLGNTGKELLTQNNKNVTLILTDTSN